MDLFDGVDDVVDAAVVYAALEDVFIFFGFFADGAVVGIGAFQGGPGGVDLPPGHAAGVVSDPPAAGFFDGVANGINGFKGKIDLDFVHDDNDLSDILWVTGDW